MNRIEINKLIGKSIQINKTCYTFWINRYLKSLKALYGYLSCSVICDGDTNTTINSGNYEIETSVSTSWASDHWEDERCNLLTDNFRLQTSYVRIQISSRYLVDTSAAMLLDFAHCRCLLWPHIAFSHFNSTAAVRLKC